jgi:hypothetical protein
VVVFRYPPDPRVNYIKRVVGLPGDRVKVVSDRVYVNGVPLDEKLLGRYSDGCYEDMRLSEVQTGEHRHQVLSCLSPYSLPVPGAPLPSCNRRIDRGYVCSEGDPPLLGLRAGRESGRQCPARVAQFRLEAASKDQLEPDRHKDRLEQVRRICAVVRRASRSSAGWYC